MADTQNRNFGLDFIRVVAIGLVLIAHFGHEDFGILGFFGVELFFGLSGYLIGRILWRNFKETNNWDLKKVHNFWARRWWRTLPNYYLFILIMLLFDTYSKDNLIPPLPQLLNYLWFGQFLLSHNLSFYTVSWSLCIEEWFYLSFPILLFLINKLKLSAKKTFSLTIIILYAATFIIKLWLIRSGHSDSIREITLGRLDAICSGVLITFCTSEAYINVKNKFVIFIAGMLLILSPLFLAAIHQISIASIQHNITFLITVPLGFSMCLPYISEFKNAGKLPHFAASSITKLSLYSYSIYLAHIPVMFLIYSFLSGIRSNSLGNLFSKILALGITILIASFIYQYFEVPFTKKRPKELKVKA